MGPSQTPGWGYWPMGNPFWSMANFYSSLMPFTQKEKKDKKHKKGKRSSKKKKSEKEVRHKVCKSTKTMSRTNIRRRSRSNKRMKMCSGSTSSSANNSDTASVSRSGEVSRRAKRRLRETTKSKKKGAKASPTEATRGNELFEELDSAMNSGGTNHEQCTGDGSGFQAEVNKYKCARVAPIPKAKVAQTSERSEVLDALDTDKMLQRKDDGMQVESQEQRNEKLRNWLMELDNGKGTLLQYYDAIRTEFDSDFSQI